MQIDEGQAVGLDDPPLLHARIALRILYDEIEADDRRSGNRGGGTLKSGAQCRMHRIEQFARLPSEEPPRAVSKRHDALHLRHRRKRESLPAQKSFVLGGERDRFDALVLAGVLRFDELHDAR